MSTQGFLSDDPFVKFFSNYFTNEKYLINEKYFICMRTQVSTAYSKICLTYFTNKSFSNVWVHINLFRWPHHENTLEHISQDFSLEYWYATVLSDGYFVKILWNIFCKVFYLYKYGSFLLDYQSEKSVWNIFHKCKVFYLYANMFLYQILLKSL